jgi:hypothetical protein
MTQRRSIAGAIKQAAQGPAPATPAVPEPKPPTGLRPFKARTREGKKMIAAPIDPAAHRQLKMLAAELDRKAEDLIREGIRDLFIKYGKLPIA